MTVFGFVDPPEIYKVPWVIILKYSPLKTDDFRFLKIEKSHSSPEIWSFKDYENIKFFSNILYIFKQFSSKFGFFFPLSHFRRFFGVEMVPRL